MGRPSAELRARIPVFYYLFDIMCSEGTDVRQRPLRERKELLRSQFSFTDPLRYTEHRSPRRRGLLQAGLPGPLGGSHRQAGRRPLPGRAFPGLAEVQVRRPARNSSSAVIPIRAARAPGFGALLLGYYDAEGRLVYAGKVGTGFDQRMLD